MSRDSDRELRRARIAEAVCALADEHGMDGVTLRDVAARAGVSMGAVQRCFRTKDEMLLFALAYVSERVTGRLTGDLAGADAGIAMLDEEHAGEARVWLAFAARAAVSPPLAEVLRRNYAQVETMFARMLPLPEARALLALADGLTTHVLVGHLSRADAAETLRFYVDRVTSGRRDAPAPADAGSATRVVPGQEPPAGG